MVKVLAMCRIYDQVQTISEHRMVLRCFMRLQRALSTHQPERSGVIALRIRLPIPHCVGLNRNLSRCMRLSSFGSMPRTPETGLQAKTRPRMKAVALTTHNAIIPQHARRNHVVTELGKTRRYKRTMATFVKLTINRYHISPVLDGSAIVPGVSTREGLPRMRNVPK